MKAKTRILFIPPNPVVRVVVEEKEEKNEALYKVTVRTGTQVNAGTSAKVGVFTNHSFPSWCSLAFSYFYLAASV